MNTVSSRSLARRSVLAATALLSGSSLLLLAACRDNVASDGAAPTTAAPSVTAASTPTSTTNLAPAPMSASPTADFAAACKPERLLAFVNTQPNRPVGNYSSVKVYQCVSGYARLYAAPKQSMPSEAGQQFFLQYTGGTWTVLKTGLGVDCGDGTPEIKDACAVFDAAAIASYNAAQSASASPH